MAAAQGRGGTVVKEQRRPMKERRRRGPPADEDAPLTRSSMTMRVHEKARTEGEWWRELGGEGGPK